MPTGLNKYKKKNNSKRKKSSSVTSSSGVDTPQKKRPQFQVLSRDSSTDTMAESVIPLNPPEWFEDFKTTITQLISAQQDRLVNALHEQSTEIRDLTAQIKDLCVANGMLEDRIISAETTANTALEKITDFEQTIATLNKKNTTLSQELLTAESYSKKCNLNFFNISESPRESISMLRHKLTEVLEVMEINLNEMLIYNIHRLPSSAPGPRPIIIKFCSLLDKSLVWSQRHLLREKNVKVYVSEHYNKEVEANIRRLNPVRKAAIQADMRAKLVADKLTINSQSYTVDTLHLLPVALQPATLAVRNLENYLFFFHEASPFSNFHTSPFIVDRTKYTCAEQYIQQKKAIMFGDISTATQVMETMDPYRMKSLGTKVQNFSSSRWIEKIPTIAKEALVAKFDQNPPLKTVLMKSETKTLIEASPKDKTWGIGCHLKDPNILHKKKDWGLNLLGKALMEVREGFR